MNYQQPMPQQAPQQQEEAFWGSLWDRQKEDGSIKTSGEIEIRGQRYWVNFMRNARKDSPAHPDYKIVLNPAPPKPQQQGPPAHQYAHQYPPQQQQYPDNSNIPF